MVHALGIAGPKLGMWLRSLRTWLVIGSFLLGWLVAWPNSLQASAQAAAAPAEASPQPPQLESPLLANASAAPLSPNSFVAQAVQKMGNAVVRIDTEQTVVRRNVPDPLLEDPLFRQFFGEDLAPRQEHLRGQGSGFIIDSSGVILTNAHVINRADKVTVTLKDGRSFAGKVQGADEVTDMAVVKIEGKNLPVASLGNSDQIQVGDWAIAIGNPLGLDNTVTLGIISTLKRSSAKVGILDKRLDFIQTDAAINPGNSGGPLVNAQGEVIGINTAIRADAMGIGFAIPINKAKLIKDQLAQGKTVPHPYLGVQMTTLTPELARENNQDPNAVALLPETQGVLVLRVLPNTPAATAGFKRGDVITSLGEQAISSADQLQSLVETAQLGQSLTVQLLRSNQPKQISVRPAQMQANDQS
jgi:S1-C subfamily serine protease